MKALLLANSSAILVSRTGSVPPDGPRIALAYVVAEVERLLQAGEALPDVVEALAELLIHP